MWTFDNKFFFLFFNLDKVIMNSTLRQITYIWQIKLVQTDAIKFERTQIDSFSDVFTALVVVVA